MINLGISGKVALVTGAGRGIGASVCEYLAEEGVRIIAVSKSKSKILDSVNSKNNLKNFFFKIDLSKNNAVKILLSKLNKIKVCPDIIVNNLGGNLNFTDPLAPIEQWRKVFKLNFETAIEINNNFLPKMIKKNWGRICHISSISALENQGTPAYCSSKAALNAYVRSVGRYFSKNNIIMTSIMPGAILTKGGYWENLKKNKLNIYKKYLTERMASKRIGQPKEISQLVVILCSQLSSFCVGTNLLADGGQGRVFRQD